MISSANSNIYEVNARSVLEVYADFLDATPAKTVVVISERPLSLSASEALKKSAAALGYGEGACAFAALTPANDAAEASTNLAAGAAHPGTDLATGTPHPGGDSEGILLGANDVLSIVEGLDPLAVVAADTASAALLARAYRTSVQPDDATRVLGRPCIAFSQLESMMESSSGKQKAWALLKKLPKLD